MSDNFEYLLKSYVLTDASTSVAVALSAAIPSSVMNGQYFVKKVDIQALFTNAGFVAVGQAPKATDGITYTGNESGYQLSQGGTVSIENVDLSKVKFIPQIANDGIMVTVHLRKTF